MVLVVVGRFTAPASATGPCAELGTVQISASSWLAGIGVDVMGNGQCDDIPSSHANTAHPSTELVDRLYAARSWGDTRLPDGDQTRDLWTVLPARGFVAQPNGAADPHPGDLIAEDSGYDQGGHVAVVTQVDTWSLTAVEQNGSASGWHKYAVSSSPVAVGLSITGGYGTVIGILHSPAIERRPQVVTFGAAPHLTVGESGTVTALSSGAGTIAYDTSDATCSVESATGVVRGLAPGSCTIRATAAATDVDDEGSAVLRFPVLPPPLPASPPVPEVKEDLVYRQATGANDAFAGISDGLGTFSWTNVPALGRRVGQLGLGDVDNDGRADLVFTEAANRLRFFVGLSRGDATFRWVHIPRPSRYATQMAVADVDGDHRADIVYTAAHRGAVGYFIGLSNGDGTFRWSTIGGPHRSALHLALGDVDADGRADLVFTETTNARRYFVGFSNGEGTFRWVVIPGQHRQATQLDVADVNADGRADLVFTEARNRQRYHLGFSTGDGTFRWSVIAGPRRPASHLELGDIDGQ